MQRKIVLRFLILALIIVWMITVFRFSNQNGKASSNLSRKVVEHFVSEEKKVDQIEPYVRKIAHLSEYAAGGMLFLSLFLTYPLSDIKRIVGSLVIGIEYAALDEIHQLFIDGRSRANS